MPSRVIPPDALNRESFLAKFGKGDKVVCEFLGNDAYALILKTQVLPDYFLASVYRKSANADKPEYICQSGKEEVFLRYMEKWERYYDFL